MTGYRYVYDGATLWKASRVAAPDISVDPIVSPPTVTVPDPPATATATAAEQAVVLTWTPPASTGGSPITGYRITGPGGSIQNVGPDVATFRWAPLTAGVSVSFNIQAGNAVGLSIPAVTNTATPTAPPTNPPSDLLFGWDSKLWTPPAERALETWPYHDNTGLYRSADRSALALHQGDFTTSSDGQRIERLDITGDIFVRHAGVKFKLCRIRGRVEYLLAGEPPHFYFCDAICNNGQPTTAGINLTRGNGQFYACNISGYCDGISIGVSSISNVPTSLFQDCFVHDPRQVRNDFFGVGEPDHTDLVKMGSGAVNGCKFDVIHSTMFTASTNNYTAAESWTRSSGPNWTAGTTALTCTFLPAGGGIPNGRINAGIMVANGKNHLVRAYRSLWRGPCYTYFNGQAGNRLYAVDNLVAPDEVEPGRSANALGNRANFIEWRGNVRFDTRQPW